MCDLFVRNAHLEKQWPLALWPGERQTIWLMVLWPIYQHNLFALCQCTPNILFSTRQSAREGQHQLIWKNIGWPVWGKYPQNLMRALRRHVIPVLWLKCLRRQFAPFHFFIYLFHYNQLGKVAEKHRHRRNVTSHHSLSLLWQFQLLKLSSLNNFHHWISFITR